MTATAEIILARPNDRDTEYVGRCIYRGRGPDLRPLCAPDLAYGHEDLDLTDTGKICPDCHDEARDLAHVAAVATTLPRANEDIHTHAEDAQ